jgi:hypothetical protein
MCAGGDSALRCGRDRTDAVGEEQVDGCTGCVQADSKILYTDPGKGVPIVQVSMGGCANGAAAKNWTRVTCGTIGWLSMGVGTPGLKLPTRLVGTMRKSSKQTPMEIKAEKRRVS